MKNQDQTSTEKQKPFNKLKKCEMLRTSENIWEHLRTLSAAVMAFVCPDASLPCPSASAPPSPDELFWELFLRRSPRPFQLAMSTWAKHRQASPNIKSLPSRLCNPNWPLQSFGGSFAAQVSAFAEVILLGFTFVVLSRAGLWRFWK